MKKIFFTGLITGILLMSGCEVFTDIPQTESTSTAPTNQTGTSTMETTLPIGTTTTTVETMTAEIGTSIIGTSTTLESTSVRIGTATIEVATSTPVTSGSTSESK